MEDIDTNGDGHISKGEMDMHLEFKTKRTRRCRCNERCST